MNMAVENFIFMNLERSMEMMSVPPDVAPNFTMIPTPAPISTPPNMAATSKLSEKLKNWLMKEVPSSGFSPTRFVMPFMTSGVTSAANTVLAPKVFPNTIRPIIISGISIIRPNVPVCIEGTR